MNHALQRVVGENRGLDGCGTFSLDGCLSERPSAAFPQHGFLLKSVCLALAGQDSYDLEETTVPPLPGGLGATTGCGVCLGEPFRMAPWASH